MTRHEFDQALSRAEMNRQNAHTAALATCEAAIQKLHADHAEQLAEAKLAFAAVEDDPDHPLHGPARKALDELSRVNISDKPLADVMGAAIAEADRVYNAEFARLVEIHSTSSN